MRPTKAPGPDGFPALFFQKYWHIVGEEVVIGRCIDEAQSAFVPGRLISDNVFLAYEILHTFRQKRTGKKGYMAVKLDMSKAYDRVEWDFLKEVMLRMGFANEWMELIMKCITTTSYTINTSGERGRIFQASRGLRQGDTLSPFLFLLCSEGLSSLMRLALKKSLLKGAKASRRSLKFSHLLFATDCILFGEASDRGAIVIKGILKETWKKELIDSNFSEEVVEKILGIPLAEEPHEDFRAWSGEPSGEYTVRSAYKLLQSNDNDPRAYALQTDYKEFDKKLWPLNLPSKIKLTI
ncbi:hypothetical protein J1N35_006001 [Gossypium stocksii]|uniref:Reverse transcriptase domain-containing protein n=1 Tax=Gossypium stocksii TaxID=47602 RepID=A0A9D4AJV2_9ROSI|nr:hypothetical protein J1N35_006001 [Gossypium stocksii]